MWVCMDDDLVRAYALEAQKAMEEEAIVELLSKPMQKKKID